MHEPDLEPHLIDSSPWELAVDMFMALSAHIIQSTLTLKSVTKLVYYTREISRLSRRIRGAETENIYMAALLRLGSDAAWRAQVRRELGGDWVIKRWEAFFEFQTGLIELGYVQEPSTQERPVQESQMQQEAASPQQNIKSHDRTPRQEVTTAAEGLFRLAPIPRCMPLEAGHRAWPESGYNNAPYTAQTKAFAPYPLFPDEIGMAHESTISNERAAVEVKVVKVSKYYPKPNQPFETPLFGLGDYSGPIHVPP